MIGERNMVQEFQIILMIESTPAAVAILHAHQPCQPVANALRSRAGSGSATRPSAINTNAVSSTSG